MKTNIKNDSLKSLKRDMQNHPFDDAIQLSVESDGYRGHTSENYSNMVGPFGGLIAATLLKAALDHPERQGEPLALTVNYAAPIADGDFTIKATPVRTNRSTQHWNIILSQQGLICATATAVFAVRRKTWLSTEAKFPDVPDAKTISPVSAINFPSFLNNYDIRIICGGFPRFTSSQIENSGDSVTIEWIKDKPDRNLDFLSLTAICDIFIPRILVRRNRFTNIGTVSLTVYFHTDSASLRAHGEKALLGHARALKFYNNYFDQTAEIWTPTRELLASTSQVVYFKE